MPVCMNTYVTVVIKEDSWEPCCRYDARLGTSCTISVIVIMLLLQFSQYRVTVWYPLYLPGSGGPFITNALGIGYERLSNI